ncbi:sensor histidine kinase [Salarchaeum japonicum]|uniref:histidine kinase n=1 Tax=Salarchaeum japonicum TaxID=555573 RepID=A0AAV3T2U6_9EURY|nr:ATP-binding protein [Salarchaeum japonicum]
MDGLLLAHVAVFAVSAVLCAVSIPRALAIQHADTRWGLVGLLGSVGLWAAGYVGYLVAPTNALREAFYILGFSFAFVAVGAFLYFCAAYTGRPPRRVPYRKTALAAFAVVVGLKVTNPLHEFYFTTEWTTTPFPHLAVVHQPAYWLILGLSYALTAVGFFMLLERFYRTGTDSRPLVVLLVLTGVPALATTLGEEIDWLLPLMYEPPGVALFAVGVLFVYARRFEAIRLTSNATDPAVFLDADGRVRDYNTAALAILPSLDGSVGAPIDRVNDLLAAELDDPGVVAVEDDTTRYYQVSTAPFTAGDARMGQLVTLTDVTDRETYRRQLESKTEQLEALTRVVRHDIRNDMTVITGWGETLRDHVDDDGRDALDRVLRTADHVVDVTDTVGEFLDALSGAASLDLRPVSLHRTLTAELAAVRESHPDADYAVEGAIPDVDVRATGLLSSVFRNLLENAARHSDRDTPSVTVSCTERDDTVEIRVADDGPGIPDAQKSRLFDRGEKGAASPGSGIGLYLVQTLVEQFDGTVHVEDNDPRGAVFVVELERAV